MYLFIPIGIFAVSLCGIIYFVGRKFVYLKKLTTEAISDPPATANTFWAGFFPEIIALYEKINWREYRVRITTESEKSLRQIRLAFLKIDTFTHKLTQRLRRSTKHHEAILKKEEEEAITEAIVDIPKTAVMDPKEEEQHIIMEIAKNPKDKLLYLRLGDVYLKMNDNENARLSFKTVLDLDADNWYAKKMRADLAQRWCNRFAQLPLKGPA